LPGEKRAGSGFNSMTFNLFVPPGVLSAKGRLMILFKNHGLLSVALNPVFPSLAENVVVSV